MLPMRISDELLEEIADKYVDIKSRFEKERGIPFQYNLEQYIRKTTDVKGEI